MKTTPLFPRWLMPVLAVLVSPAFAQDADPRERPLDLLDPVHPNPGFRERLMPEMPAEVLPQPGAEWDIRRRLSEPDQKALLQLLDRYEVRQESDAPRWKIGVGVVPVEPVLRRHLAIPPDTGLVVTNRIEGGPAAKGGILKDDILVAAGDRKLGTLEELREAVAEAGKSGRALDLTVIHEGKRRQVRVMPDGPPTIPVVPQEDPGLRRPSGRASGVPAERMMAQVNRRFDAMEQQLKEMRRLLQRQQRMIEEMRGKMMAGTGSDAPAAADSAPRRGRNRREAAPEAVPEADRPRDIPTERERDRARPRDPAPERSRDRGLQDGPER